MNKASDIDDYYKLFNRHIKCEKRKSEGKKDKYVTEADFLEQMMAESDRCTRAKWTAEKALILSWIEAVVLVVVLAILVKMLLFG